MPSHIPELVWIPQSFACFCAPSRPVVAQAMADAEKNLANWTLGAFAKVMEGKIKAWDMRYQENPGTQAGARAASRARGGETILEKINRLKAELGITD